MQSKYKIYSYGNLFKSVKNGIASRNYSRVGTRYLKVSDIKTNFISDSKTFYVSTCKDSDFIKPETLLITRKGTVGNSYFLKEDRRIVASSEIFIITIDSKLVDGDYLSEVNLSQFVKNQYIKKSTGTIMPSLSQERLKSIKIPLPALSKQKEIVKKITSMKKEIKNLKISAEKNRKAAISDFEAQIFTN